VDADIPPEITAKFPGAGDVRAVDDDPFRGGLDSEPEQRADSGSCIAFCR
jgi:hypothetical protein